MLSEKRILVQVAKVALEKQPIRYLSQVGFSGKQPETELNGQKVYEGVILGPTLEEGRKRSSTRKESEAGL